MECQLWEELRFHEEYLLAEVDLWNKMPFQHVLDLELWEELPFHEEEILAEVDLWNKLSFGHVLEFELWEELPFHEEYLLAEIDIWNKLPFQYVLEFELWEELPFQDLGLGVIEDVIPGKAEDEHKIDDAHEVAEERITNETISSVRRDTFGNGKIFLQSEYTGKRSTIQAESGRCHSGTLKVNAAANVKMGKQSTLRVCAGEIDILIEIWNNPKEQMKRKLKWMRKKEFAKTCNYEPIMDDSDQNRSAAFGVRILDRERSVVQSSFIQCGLKTTLHLRVDLSLKWFNLSQSLTFSVEDMDVFLLVTNVPKKCLRPLIKRKMKKVQLLGVSGSSIVVAVEETESSVSGVVIPNQLKVVGEPKKRSSKLGKFWKMFCLNKVSPAE